MGIAKHETEVRADAWLQTAYSKSYRCAACGIVIEDCEKEIYFRSGMCGAHARAEDKDQDRRGH